MKSSSISWKRLFKIPRRAFGGATRQDERGAPIVPSILRMNFDSVYYLQMYPDVASAQMSPLTHYLLYGAREGRNPTSYFSTSDYVARFGSEIPVGMNPFHHFLVKEEARNSSAKYDPDVTVAEIQDDPDLMLRVFAGKLQLPFYIEFNNLDGEAFDTVEDAARHYIEHGAAMGYDPEIGFSTSYYLESQADVASANVNPYFHYLMFGNQEGRTPLPRSLRRRAHSSLVDLFLSTTKLPKKASHKKSLRDDVSIVVPVFNALDDVKELLEAMENTLHSDQEILLIDDCSSDPRIQKTLQEWVPTRAGAKLITLKENLGYSAAVNTGMTNSKKHVAILNTDLLLPPGWLDRIMAPIDREPDDVATVTPFSNTSSLTGFPEMANEGENYLNLSVDEIDRSFQINQYDFDLPSGCGFCLAVNRRAIEKTGSFDSEAYGQGYYEETDWCQRAAQNGFRNVIAPDLYVHHKPGSSSFGVEKRKTLSNQNRPKFAERNPHYRDQLRLYRFEDPGAESRQLAKLRLWREKATDCIIVLSHTWGGGTETFSLLSQKSTIEDGGLIVNFRLSGTRARAEFFFGTESLKFEDTGFSACIDIIKKLNPARAEIHGLHGINDPQHFADLLSKSVVNCELHLFVHDFLTVCPSVHLLDSSGSFCNVPPKNVCHNCLSSNRFSLYPVFSISEWRDRWHSFLGCTSRIVAFHSETARLIRKTYPDIADKVTVSEPEYDPGLPSVRTPPGSQELKIGVFGRIDYHKGAQVIRKLCDHLLQAEEERASIHLFGSWPCEPVPPNIVICGDYTVSEMPGLIEEAAIDVVFFPSVCPETYSFTLSELFSMNVPVVALDIGAQGARVKEYARGSVCSGTDPETVLGALKHAASLWRL